MEVKSTVYIVSTDRPLSKALGALLNSYGISIESFADAQDFLQVALARPVQNSCLLLELGFPPDQALALIRQLRREDRHLPVIALGEATQEESGRAAIEAGATDYINKPLAAAYLFTRLAKLAPGVSQPPCSLPSKFKAPDGGEITFRMMQPEDAGIEQDFVLALSDRSKYLRFFSGLDKLPASVLKEFTTPDFPISYAVIATVSEEGQERQIGVARYAPTGTEGVAEFAVVVADDFQGQGIASQLMRLVITAATVGGIKRVEGLILRENEPMLAMAEKMGFTHCPDHDAGPSAALYAKQLRDA